MPGCGAAREAVRRVSSRSSPTTARSTWCGARRRSSTRSFADRAPTRTPRSGPRWPGAARSTPARPGVPQHRLRQPARHRRATAGATSSSSRSARTPGITGDAFDDVQHVRQRPAPTPSGSTTPTRPSWTTRCPARRPRSSTARRCRPRRCIDIAGAREADQRGHGLVTGASALGDDCSRRSRARRRGSGTSARCRSGPTRSRSCSGSSWRSSSATAAGSRAAVCPATSPTWRSGRSRSGSSAAGSTTSSPTTSSTSAPTARASSPRCGSGTAASASGARSRSAASVPGSAAAAAGSRCRRSPTRSRPASSLAQAIGRFGNWFNQELFGAPTDPAVGPGDRPGEPPGGLRAVRDLPPDLPLRVALVRARVRAS